jgi:hypothetical protein
MQCTTRQLLIPRNVAVRVGRASVVRQSSRGGDGPWQGHEEASGQQIDDQPGRQR